MRRFKVRFSHVKDMVRSRSLHKNIAVFRLKNAVHHFLKSVIICSLNPHSGNFSRAARGEENLSLSPGWPCSHVGWKFPAADFSPAGDSSTTCNQSSTQASSANHFVFSQVGKRRDKHQQVLTFDKLSLKFVWWSPGRHSLHSRDDISFKCGLPRLPTSFSIKTSTRQLEYH